VKQQTKAFLIAAVSSILIYFLILLPGFIISRQLKKPEKKEIPKVTSYEYNAKNKAIKAALEMMNPLFAKQYPDWNQDVFHVHEYDDFYIFVSNNNNEVTIKIIFKEQRK
jgi:ABC-type protease/lipase transport system fused ATPase/permease subunit